MPPTRGSLPLLGDPTALVLPCLSPPPQYDRHVLANGFPDAPLSRDASQSLVHREFLFSFSRKNGCVSIYVLYHFNHFSVLVGGEGGDFIMYLIGQLENRSMWSIYM